MNASCSRVCHSGVLLNCFQAPKKTAFSKLSSFAVIFRPVSEFELMHVDEFIDQLLHSERICDIILPRLQVRKEDVC